MELAGPHAAYSPAARIERAGWQSASPLPRHVRTFIKPNGEGRKTIALEDQSPGRPGGFFPVPLIVFWRFFSRGIIPSTWNVPGLMLQLDGGLPSLSPRS